MKTFIQISFLLTMTGFTFAYERGPIEVQGHRGARAVLPENTWPAFEYGLKVGVDTLELDLGVTKDNFLVVMHDQVLNPSLCIGPKGRRLAKRIPVRSFTFKKLRQYDCGTLKNKRFPKQKAIPGTKVPSLKEVFDWVRKSKHPAAKTVQFRFN